jgi:hypothetical protein
MLNMQTSKDQNFFRNVLLKGLILFLVANLVFAALKPMPFLGRISAYNHLFPGRVRLPYGERPDVAYNLSLFNLDAMFASHEIASIPKPKDEYRVILIGDSSTWGFLLKPQDTLSALLNAQPSSVAGRRLRVYNLGYPTMTITKDLVMLQYAIRYQPDLVIWMMTLESMPREKQLASENLQHNPEIVRNLISVYKLRLSPTDPSFIHPTFLDRTFAGERRALADIIRLQVYGVMWSATGIDQYYPEKYDPPQRDLDPDDTFHGLKPPTLNPDDLALEVLDAGVKMAGNIPILFINEPIYISDGRNSDIRYNFFYPRWVYDQYRQLMAERSRARGLFYFDMWDLVTAVEFTNSAIHLTPTGEALLAEHVSMAIMDVINK